LAKLGCGYDLWRLRLFSFGGYGLALAALALLVFGAYDSYPLKYSAFLRSLTEDLSRKGNLSKF